MSSSDPQSSPVHTSGAPAHAHGHNHSRDHGSTVKYNVEYFNQLAEHYENFPNVRELSAHLGAAIRDILASLSSDSASSLDVLDFACGIGMLSRELAPAVSNIVGVDISPGSVDVYNRKAATDGYAKKMHAATLNLQGTPGELDDKRFNAAVITMGCHHFDSPEQYIKVLAHYLKPGGVLIVADLMERSADGPGYAIPEDLRPAVAHLHGFSENTMRTMFESAGLMDVKYSKSYSMPTPATDLPEEQRIADIFLAHATKPKL